MCQACQNKINGRKKMAKKHKTRRRRAGVRGVSSKGISNFATQTLLPGVAGAIAGNFLNRLPFIKDNPQYAPWAAAIGGTLVATASKNSMIQAAGMGMAISGVAQVAGDLLDGVKGVGLLPPGVPSRGVAGNGEEQEIAMQF
jgi:hypothetical protein